MTRDESNTDFMAALKKYGVSTIKIDLHTNTVVLGFASQELHEKFTTYITESLEQMQTSIVSDFKTFDMRLNINMVGLFLKDVSELELESLNFPTPYGSYFSDRSPKERATATFDVGIVRTKIEPVEGKVIDNGTYYLED